MPTTDTIFFDYEALQRDMELGPIPAAYFACLVGQRQWAVVEDTDGSEAIAEIEIRRTLAANQVEILIFDRDHPKGYAYKLPADELAIRIEAS